MKKGEKRPLNLFFAEIIIALLFFSISGAVILKVFAAADRKSHKSAELERVIICAQSIAEAYSVYGSSEKALSAAVGKSGEEITLDSECVPTEGGSIVLRTKETRNELSSGTLSKLKIAFSREEGEIYSLDCSAFIPKGGAGNE